MSRQSQWLFEAPVSLGATYYNNPYASLEFKQEEKWEGADRELSLKIVTPKPNISDFVDLNATVLARGRVKVPIKSIKFLVAAQGSEPTWWTRLWVDPAKVYPNVLVTVELAQFSDVSMNPKISGSSGIFSALGVGLREYLERLHKYPYFVGAGLYLETREKLEQDLGIKGQLNSLIKKSGIKLPMSSLDQQRLFWIVYASFPIQIEKYVLRQDRVVLDRFDFNKSTLKKDNVAKVGAIARYIVSMSLKRSPLTIRLEGHTDPRGTEDYNKGLGDRRALEVKKALISAIDAIRAGTSKRINIETKSFGETKPFVSGSTEDIHARNRRIEVFLPTPLPQKHPILLRDVAKRASELLRRTGNQLTPEQVQRISCLLNKVMQKGVDDRYVDPQLVLDYYNSAKTKNVADKSSLTNPYFIFLREALSNVDVFGPNVSDAKLLKNLEVIDGNIVEGMGKVNKLIDKASGALSSTLSLGFTPPRSIFAAIEWLRNWMFHRVKDNLSIYSCYRDV